jgi:hypothetical protein
MLPARIATTPSGSQTARAITTGSLDAVGFGAGSTACRGPTGGGWVGESS